jgi:hypothetical protein
MKLQGLCLLSEPTHNYMNYYDKLPEHAQKALQQSPFNLCAACVYYHGTGDYMEIIKRMERKLREEQS